MYKNSDDIFFILHEEKILAYHHFAHREFVYVFIACPSCDERYFCIISEHRFVFVHNDSESDDYLVAFFYLLMNDTCADMLLCTITHQNIQWVFTQS